MTSPTQPTDAERYRTCTRRAVLRRTAGVAVAAVGAPAATGTTARASNTPPQGILADGMGSGAGVDYRAFGRGMYSSGSGVGSPPPETLADRMRNEFNANAGAWVAYGNWLLEEMDVSALGSATIAVDVTVTRIQSLSNHGTVSTVIDAEYDTDEDEFVDLDWTVDEDDDADYAIELRNDAAKNAADELQEFRREFIDEDGDDDHEVPDNEWLSELAGKYAGSIRLGEDSRHVLELLLGEVEL